MFQFIFDYNYSNSWILYQAGITCVTSTEYVSTLDGKTKSNTKTANRLLQCVLLNRLFENFGESRSMFVSFPVC